MKHVVSQQSHTMSPIVFQHRYRNLITQRYSLYIQHKHDTKANMPL